MFLGNMKGILITCSTLGLLTFEIKKNKKKLGLQGVGSGHPPPPLPSHICIGWLNVNLYIVYIEVKRKKPTHSVEYVVNICNAHDIIKSQRFSILLG